MNGRYAGFVEGFGSMLEAAAGEEARILREGSDLLRLLVMHDDWLAPQHASAPASGYAQYLLHRDPQARFCVVSFVWAPSAMTPVHDHTVWGLVGVMRGAELCHEYDWPVPGQPMKRKGSHRLEAGDVDRVSPAVGDVHAVENAFGNRASVSIHVYGADIGCTRRHVFDPSSGAIRPFVSGYTPVGRQPPLGRQS